MTVIPQSKGAPRAPLFRLSSESIVLALLAVLILSVSVAPMLRLAQAALFDDGGLAVERLAKLFSRPQTGAAIWNTVQISLASTLVSVLVGTIFAVIMVQTDLRGKSALVFAFVLPLMIPPQVTAMAWIQAFSPSSPVLGLLGLSMEAGTRHPLYSKAGIILLLGIYNAPLVYLAMQASLRRIPLDLAEAARAAGARPGRVLLTVILPLARGGMVAAASLAFVSAIGNFGIQAMLGIPARVPTLITQIYQQINGLGPGALPNMAALSLVLTALTVAGVLLAARDRSDTRVDLGSRPLMLPLGRSGAVIAALLWTYLVVSLLLPLSGAGAASLVPAYGLPLTAETMTLKNYVSALFQQVSLRDAFVTSLWLTLVTVGFLMLASVFLGYFLTWRRGPLVRLLHFGSEAAYTLPGITLGVAMILLFLRPLPGIGVSIYGTPWIILAAYVAGFFALALRPVLSGYAQIDRALEEAARVAGAGFLRRMRDVIWPLIAPTAIAAAVIVFMTAINEIQTSILLISSGTRTIGPMIIFLEEGGASTLAAAVGCLMILGVLALMLLSTALSRFLPKGVLPWQF
ncbi:iron ABC transporter permease [Paracoccus mutanolyticus]|uniref:Iron ABC transporter permease n=1 Tax=Paracoccus mutanolyticus TaxID=1499308 RepID=A0ABM6WTP4_9RHOB|nr:iron ABC transporter permease [Paracoccus mutanolyticus]AWX93963.1 iron ABC transporter permease [Paracoccus mutanolyticus]